MHRAGENLADSIEGSALQVFCAGFYDGDVEQHEHNRRAEPGGIDTAIAGGGGAGLNLLESLLAERRALRESRTGRER